MTLAELRKRVSDENDAYLLLEELRWHGTPICAHCGHDKAYVLTPRNGVSRGTGPKDANGRRSQSVRRVYKCAKCRKQFSVLTNTIFHGTKVALSDWLTVMVLMASAKNGISAREVERLIGVTPETAWFMTQRLRETMKREPLVGMLRGTITADETYIGGKPRNRHRQGRPTKGAERGKRKGPFANKVPVFSLVNRETGEVRSTVVPDVTGATLAKIMAEQVDMASSVLHTDAGLQEYKPVGQQYVAHEWVDHSANEYVRGSVTTNHAEGYFSQLKRSLDGTHHHVSREHLARYLAEFDFRFNTRKLSDSARLERMVDQAEGRRLSYKPLVER